MTLSGNLGYPRIGKNRELKFALEKYWGKTLSKDDLLQIEKIIQISNWVIQKDMGLDFIPSNDFSFYDQVLDTAFMLGAIPDRFTNEQNLKGLDLYFAMARGYQYDDGRSIPAMEMTKWFNTNYHYIVPEINPDTKFKLNAEKITSAFQLAQTLNITSRPVILGPISFLLLSKSDVNDYSPLSKLNEIIPLYTELLKKLEALGVKWVQLDEPALSTDFDFMKINAYRYLFQYFNNPATTVKVMLTTYFGDLSSNAVLAAESPFDGLHIDMTTCSQPDEVFARLKGEKIISLGFVNGRNIWKNDLTQTLKTIKSIRERYHFQDMILAPSCSLLHVPQDLNMETKLDNDVFTWLAFAKQKLEEIAVLKKSANNNFTPSQSFIENQTAINSRKKLVKKAKSGKSNFSLTRQSQSRIRKEKQQNKFDLPILPTTTIGSFPQTTDVRRLRSSLRNGDINSSEYRASLKQETEKTIRFQEEIGLDVLVHGEFERNDMVQYFAEQLEGFTFTQNGWVQSFGSRCVRPPIIFSNVSRPRPMTVEWAAYAQSLTNKPVKGMLTGPVTILQWSFVRDDQPRSETCRQIASAIRAEVLDLEKAGIGIIQIDEPALREGLPLQRKDWDVYLGWAVECFQITSSGVQDETQIHTHMCYAEFNDIIDAIARMDADVISIEASRSKMELLDAFKEFKYPNDIGPGVYDIHSPNVPDVDEMVELIHNALEVIPKEQLWINPDCGLKTRRWEEVTPSLKNMLTAVIKVRQELE